ncbi:hypothetical protein BH20VER1_BH20VER1_01930 [soil metagenome]
MPADPPSENTPPPEERPSDERPSDEGANPTRPPRRQQLTPELRRFMGTQSIREDEAAPAPEEEQVAEVPLPRRREAAPARSERPRERRTAPPAAAEKPPAAAGPQETAGDEPEGRRSSRPSGPIRKPDLQAAEAIDTDRVLQVIGLLLALLLAFYVGRKFDSWKQRLFAGRQQATIESTVEARFAGSSAEELVMQALEAERAGNVQEALDRYLAAKQKNLGFRGILLRAARLCLAQDRAEEADKLFARAIALGEDVGAASSYRGRLALQRKDPAAAERFFSAAVDAEPFVAEHRHQLGETLRRAHHPTLALPHYARAALLAQNEQERVICHFEIRMARVESAHGPKTLAAELEALRQSGSLSVDWLMTAAALHIRDGRLKETIPLVEQARAAGEPELFAACTSDLFFVHASARHPQLAEITRAR